MQSGEQDAQEDHGHHRPEGLVQLAQYARHENRNDQDNGAEVKARCPVPPAFPPILFQNIAFRNSTSCEYRWSATHSLWPFWRNASVSRAFSSSVALRLMSWPICVVCCASACDFPSSFCPTGR